MAELRGKRVLVTGPAGQIAFPLARELARHNEVWGVARFACREWEISTTIARMNVSYGPNGGLPAYARSPGARGCAT